MYKFLLSLMLCVSMISCSYNPFVGSNQTTGNPLGALLGVGIGGGGASLLHASKPVVAITGTAGGALGYYLTTLRHDAADIILIGGKVYTVGDYLGIYLPTDQIFEPNTATFLPQAVPILNSVVTVLRRFPDHNIIVSGNTSGFFNRKWEQKLSEKRAQRITAFLWYEGINEFKPISNDMRKLTYVGYGDYFPIASDYTNHGIRTNSRIQITAYPGQCDIHLGSFQGEKSSANHCLNSSASMME